MVIKDISFHFAKKRHLTLLNLYQLSLQVYFSSIALNFPDRKSTKYI